MPDATIFLADTLYGNFNVVDPFGGPLVYSMTPEPDSAYEQYQPVAHINPTTGDYWFVGTSADVPQRTITFTATNRFGHVTTSKMNVNVTYYIDQRNDVYGGAANVDFYAPMGQEFVPALSALDVVELLLGDATNSSDPSQLFVRIRDGSVMGAVVATSDVVPVTLPIAGTALALFRFTRVALVPGHQYVLEVVHKAGPVVMIGRNQNGYASGNVIYNGNPDLSFDLWFREGALKPQPGP
jgi:hypothetical protein